MNHLIKEVIYAGGLMFLHLRRTREARQPATASTDTTNSLSVSHPGCAVKVQPEVSKHLLSYFYIFVCLFLSSYGDDWWGLQVLNENEGYNNKGWWFVFQTEKNTSHGKPLSIWNTCFVFFCDINFMRERLHAVCIKFKLAVWLCSSKDTS